MKPTLTCLRQRAPRHPALSRLQTGPHLWRYWKDNIPCDDARYLAALAKRHSPRLNPA